MTVRLVRVYRRSLGAHLRAVLEYQSDFWLLVTAGIVTQSLGFIFLSAVFARVPTLNGWRFEETVLIYALAGLAQAAVPLVADGAWLLGSLVHTGELDYRVVRPYPPVLQVTSHQIGFSGAGDAIGAGVLLVWALSRVEVHWTPVKVLLGLLILLGAVVIRIAITVATNAIAFWIPSPNPMFASAVFQIGELARYPLTIYGFGLRVVLTGLLPFAFTGFLPAAWLLDQGGAAWLGLATPVVAALCALAAYAVFQRGLRRYESAGH
ncbi:ABC-2 family transporter protein [Polymorphospora sp. NPDC050346]|uniref:ABC transporter permease n=1 Tax=Polymorphospora sp. NPDC050346 TaxID=3155780 RepID=UPI003400D97F